MVTAIITPGHAARYQKQGAPNKGAHDYLERLSTRHNDFIKTEKEGTSIENFSKKQKLDNGQENVVAHCGNGKAAVVRRVKEEPPEEASSINKHQYYWSSPIKAERGTDVPKDEHEQAVTFNDSSLQSRKVTATAPRLHLPSLRILKQPNKRQGRQQRPRQQEHEEEIRMDSDCESTIVVNMNPLRLPLQPPVEIKRAWTSDLPKRELSEDLRRLSPPDEWLWE